MGRSKSFGQVNVPDLKCLRKFKSGRNHITDYPLCKTQNHVFCLSLFKLSRNPISRLCVVYYSVRVIEMDKLLSFMYSLNAAISKFVVE